MFVIVVINNNTMKYNSKVNSLVVYNNFKRSYEFYKTFQFII